MDRRGRVIRRAAAGFAAAAFVTAVVFVASPGPAASRAGGHPQAAPTAALRSNTGAPSPLVGILGLSTLELVAELWFGLVTTSRGQSGRPAVWPIRRRGPPRPLF